MFKVGLIEQPLYNSYSPTALGCASYLTAIGNRVDSFWLPDHLGSLFPQSVTTPYAGTAPPAPEVDAYYEAWTVSGYLATRNALGRHRVGIGVSDSASRNPAVTARAAATLHLLTRGRAILGIGTGARTCDEPYRAEGSKPVARFEEALATIRALWDSGGERVTRDSPFFPLRNAVFDLPPYRGRWPDIWIAAHGPRILRATGRYADGWFPAAMTMRPKDYAAGLEEVRAAASDAGRDPMSITAAGLFFVMTGRSRQLDVPAQLGDRHGGSHPSLLQECLLTGTSGDVIQQVSEWRDHGLQYAVISNISSVQPGLRRCLAATLSLTRILRELRKL